MIAELLIAAVALSFAGMGAYALARPAAILAIFGVTVETPDGRSEVRAVYGGFGLAVSGVLVYAMLHEGRGRLWIVSVISLLLLGMAGGRLFSRALERPAAFYPVWTFFWVEIVLAVMLFAAHAMS